MSKQHTPTLAIFIHESIMDIRVQNVKNDNKDAVDKLLYDLDLKVGERLDQIVSNHDRLVEALKETSRQLKLMAVLSNDDNVYRGDIDNSNITCERAEQLLTELKA